MQIRILPDSLKEAADRTELDAREETRETARRELASLASWRESLQTLERDKELLLESRATRAPEALAGLNPEERRTVYSMLELCVEALPDKSMRVRGAFGEESLVCRNDGTSRRFFTEANSMRLKFTLIVKNDRMEASFELGHHSIPR